MSEKIEQILANLKEIQQVFPEDVSLVLTDTDKIVAYLPGQTIDLGIPVGKELDKTGGARGTVTIQALLTGKIMREEKGPERYGVSYVATSNPIFEQGKVVGVLTAIVSNQKLDTLRRGATELNVIVNQMAAATDEMTNSTDFVTSRLQELTKQSELMQASIQNVQQVTNLVKDVAKKSHILGLNAGIEAARSGEYGRGFSVVAQEIQRLGNDSRHSAEEIQKQLEKIQVEIEQINHFIREITSYTEQNSARAQEFSAAFEQIVGTASELSKNSSIADVK